jgi:anti-sigma factor ChrR (cupin superfamily)
MRGKSALVFAVVCLVAAVVLAETADKKKSSGKSAGSQPMAVAAADVKWVDLDPKGAPGVKIADMWGDHTKGAFGAFVKFPAGFATPMHTHTNAFKIVVISGTFVQGPEGKPEIRLGPGSYLGQPGGNYKHTTSCDKASDCVFFTQANGKFDLLPVEAAAK